MPYRTQSEDTSEEVERMQIEAWRRWTPAEKLARMMAMTRRIQEVQLARSSAGTPRRMSGS